MKKFLFACLISLFFVGFHSAGASSSSTSSDSYYVSEKNECAAITYICKSGYEHFSDSKGCGCKKLKETPKVCTMEYAPVCGKTKAKSCMGPGCASEYKTFSNTCMLEAADAEYKYKGECKDDDTTSLPDPTKTKYYVGDTNKCMMIKYVCESGWQYFSDSKGCGCEKKSSETISLTYEIKLRLQKLIASFIDRVEDKNYSDEKIWNILEDVKSKLELLSASNARYENVVSYTLDLIEEYQKKYESNIDSIEDIFDEY